jgi:hypothetical protein
MLPQPRDYIRSCFADATLAAEFALISGSAEKLIKRKRKDDAKDY